MVQPLAILQADCVFIASFQKGLDYELARKLMPSWLSHTACNIAEKPVPLWLRFSKDTEYLTALTSLVSEWSPQNISESVFLEKPCSSSVKLNLSQLSQGKWAVTKIIDT